MAILRTISLSTLIIIAVDGCLRRPDQACDVPLSCDSVELVTREEWRARPPKQPPVPIPTPVNMTFIHHTAGLWKCNDKQACIKQVRDIQQFHMDERGWNDIGYNFLMGEDGRVYEGRGWGIEGAHTRGYNRIAFGFCIIGNYMHRKPDQKALNATQAWLNCGMHQNYITPNYELFGHRDGGCTDCPGDRLYSIIKTWNHFSTRPIPKHCSSSSANDVTNQGDAVLNLIRQ